MNLTGFLQDILSRQDLASKSGSAAAAAYRVLQAPLGVRWFDFFL
jgi:hypothetical protein